MRSWCPWGSRRRPYAQRGVPGPGGGAVRGVAEARIITSQEKPQFTVHPGSSGSGQGSATGIDHLPQPARRARTAYLAGFNLLPIPALDGGRLMFLSYEGGRAAAPQRTTWKLKSTRWGWCSCWRSSSSSACSISSTECRGRGRAGRLLGDGLALGRAVQCHAAQAAGALQIGPRGTAVHPRRAPPGACRQRSQRRQRRRLHRGLGRAPVCGLCRSRGREGRYGGGGWPRGPPARRRRRSLAMPWRRSEPDRTRPGS